MAKLNLTYEEKITLDKWNVEVRPYLTLEDMQHIINQLITCNNGIERDMVLIADVIAVCTNMYNEEENPHYTYEEILYSGFWSDLIEACPILAGNIQTIYREVSEFNSINKKVIGLVDELTDKIKDFDTKDVNLKSIGEVIKVLTETE